MITGKRRIVSYDSWLKAQVKKKLKATKKKKEITAKLPEQKNLFE